MAHTKQAKKRVRQNEVNREANKHIKSTVRTYMKNVETAIEGGNKEEIAIAFKKAMSTLHSAVSKKVFKKSFASRNISKMAARISKSQAK